MGKTASKAKAGPTSKPSAPINAPPSETKTHVTYKGCVYPWHCDHMGHMNVMHYVGKFDEATWNFFADLGLTFDYFRDSGCGMAAVQQNIAYKRELLAGDAVEVRTRLIELRGRVIKFEHEMIRRDSGETAAICELTGVHLDRVKRKSVPFPAAFLAKAGGK